MLGKISSELLAYWLVCLLVTFVVFVTFNDSPLVSIFYFRVASSFVSWLNFQVIKIFSVSDVVTS
jgi:hypothetical protein